MSIKQHVPTVIIAALITAAAHFIPSSHPTRGAVAGVSVHQKSASVAPAGNDQVTRLVSCGGKGADIVGTDASGEVTVRSGNQCTVLFATQYERRKCVVVGGTVSKMTHSDLVVHDITGTTFSYTCE